MFNAFATELAARTGWSFTLFAGGPDPINGGRINTISYVSILFLIHAIDTLFRVDFGENLAGLEYAKATPNFRDIASTFASFLHNVYSKHHAFSMYHVLTRFQPQKSVPLVPYLFVAVDLSRPLSQKLKPCSFLLFRKYP